MVKKHHLKFQNVSTFSGDALKEVGFLFLFFLAEENFLEENYRVVHFLTHND